MNRFRSFYERFIWKILTWNVGQEISTFELENLWKKLCQTLKKQGYKVDGINMPPIKARLLESAEYRKISRIVDQLPETRSNTIEEYGKDYPTESAIGTIVRVPGGKIEYLILLSKSRCQGNILTAQGTAVPSQSYHLCHELTHVWEHLLNVKPAGILTKQVLTNNDLIEQLLESSPVLGSRAA
jgi:hypothetical protein